MEPVAELLLAQVHRGAVFGDRQIRLGGGEFRRRAVLVGGADMQDLVSAKPQIAGIGIRGQHRADQIAEMLDAVDVGQGRSDQVTCHAGSDRVPSRAGRRKTGDHLTARPGGLSDGSCRQDNAGVRSFLKHGEAPGAAGGHDGRHRFWSIAPVRCEPGVLDM